MSYTYDVTVWMKPDEPSRFSDFDRYKLSNKGSFTETEGEVEFSRFIDADSPGKALDSIYLECRRTCFGSRLELTGCNVIEVNEMPNVDDKNAALGSRRRRMRR